MLQKLTFLVLAGAVLFACQPQHASKENVTLIENYVNAVENLDYDAMDEILADDYIGIGPSVGDTINKENAIANWKKNVTDLYAKIDYNKSKTLPLLPPDGQADGEWVSNWAELTISYKDGEKDVTLMTNTIYQIKGGKVVKTLTFYNEADALRQLGFVFINPDNLN